MFTKPSRKKLLKPRGDICYIAIFLTVTEPDTLIKSSRPYIHGPNNNIYIYVYIKVIKIFKITSFATSVLHVLSPYAYR